MNVKNSVYEAILEVGGPTQASFLLHVNSQTIHAWVRKGYVPSFEKAKKLAKASGVHVDNLRKQGGRGILALGRFS
jgi:D-Tyr-tRNAtyr deacylase